MRVMLTFFGSSRSRKNKNLTLSTLIRELNSIKKLLRIRYITSHPKDMNEELINCYKDCEKLMPLLHLPVQSGSDKILKLMNRKHDRNYCLSVIKNLKKLIRKSKYLVILSLDIPRNQKKIFMIQLI